MVGIAVYVALMWRMTGESVLAAVLATIALGILLRGAMILVFGTQTQYPLRDLGWSNASLPLRRAHLGRRACARARDRAGVCGPLRVPALHALGHPHARRGPTSAARRAARHRPARHLRARLGTRHVHRRHGRHADRLRRRARRHAGDHRPEGLPAALVGGLDSLVGALVGSLVVAAAEVLLIHHVDPLLSDVVPFAVLLAMLAVRPWGLFGTREELDRV